MEDIKNDKRDNSPQNTEEKENAPLSLSEGEKAVLLLKKYAGKGDKYKNYLTNKAVLDEVRSQRI